MLKVWRTTKKNSHECTQINKQNFFFHLKISKLKAIMSKDSQDQKNSQKQHQNNNNNNNHKNESNSDRASQKSASAKETSPNSNSTFLSISLLFNTVLVVVIAYLVAYQNKTAIKESKFLLFCVYKLCFFLFHWF